MLRYSFVACVGSLISVCYAIAAPYGQLKEGNKCTDVVLLRQNGLDSLPLSTSARLRGAVEPSLRAIVSNKAMGLEGTDVRRVSLRVVLVAADTKQHALYVVSWEDGSFGVNGAIWIVELTGETSRNLIPVQSKRAPGFELGGFGFGVLSSSSSAYPEIMIASSGFKDGGGAEAEATCIRKGTQNYEITACPAGCKEALNNR